jgi:predicted RNA-binding protein Jag
LNKVMTISGLNSTERRIIHRQLRDNDEVDTESVGDGIFRRLRIEPNG